MPQTIGSEEILVGLRFLGCPEGPVLLEALLEIITAVDMQPDGQPDVRHYPNGHGKGGHGWQIYQPLTESWIVGGTWPRLVVPITRVVLSSCRPFATGVVIAVGERLIGQMVPGYGGRLSL